MSRKLLPAILAVALGAGAAVVRAQPGPCRLPLLAADRLGPATELVRQGQILWLVAGASLLSFDISDPAHPIGVGRLDLDFAPVELSISGDVLAAAAGERGLVLFDVADPAHPVQTAELDTPGYVAGVSSTPGRVYLADRRITDATVPRGILILDVSDPSAPTELGSHPFGDFGAIDVAVRNGIAYAKEYLGPLHLLDVTDPVSMPELGAVTVWGEKVDVDSAGSAVFVFETNFGHFVHSAVFLVDTSDPSSPVLRSWIYSWEDDDTLFSSFALGDGLLFLGDFYDFFWVYDVSDLSTPVLLSSIPGAPASRDLVRAGGFVYAASSADGLQVVDATNPLLPSIVAIRPTPPETWGVAASGSVALFRTTKSLRAFDVSDPGRPRPLGGMPGLPVPSWVPPPAEVAEEAGLVYVPEASGMRILDMIDPSHPSTLGSFALPTMGLGVAVKDDLAFLGANSEYGDSLRVLDVSDPSGPHQVGSYGAQYWTAERIAVEGHLLAAGGEGFVSGGESVRLVDISDPAEPTELSRLALASATALELEAGLLYVSTGAHLKVFDLATPTAPVQRGAVAIESGISDLAVAHRRAAVVGHGRARVVDLRDPDSPVVVGEAPIAGDGYGVAFDRGRIYVADGRFGFAIYGDCPFFADGFESGDTSQWSEVQP